jgi:membrane peptidoglycan carboxypeptidase
MSMFLVTSVVAGVLVGGLVLPVAAIVSGGVNTSASVLAETTNQTLDPLLPQTSVLKAADGSVITHFFVQNRTVVPITKISTRMQQSIVAIEDARFYTHGAIDPKGLVRALVNNSAGGDTQGASTITQQLVKNAEVVQASVDGDEAAAKAAIADTVERKVTDIRLAATLEKTLTKPEILARYLNIVYFGDQTYGVEAAAQRYFGVSAAKLNIVQAATLAGMVQSPAAFDPVQHPDATKGRRDQVLKDMMTQKMITPEQYAKAVATKVRVTGKMPANGCANAPGDDGYFCQYVVQSIVKGTGYSALGKSAAARMKAIMRGGLVITSTLDQTTQKAAQEAVDAKIPRKDPSGLATSAVTVEPGTGKVVAMAQNRTFSVTSGKGKTSINYGVDKDLGGAAGFQTGSSFKPFTLADWLSTGHGLDDSVNATKRAFSIGEFKACGTTLTNAPDYSPGNSEGDESGNMSVKDATVNSVNVAYVEMEAQLDLCDVAKTAESLGVHLAEPLQQCVKGAKVSTDLPTCIPSLTLGVEPIAPLTMAAAYAGFASGGTFCTPVPVVSIKKAGKNDPSTRKSVSLPGSTCTQALTESVANGVSQALEGVLTHGTAAAVGPLNPWPSAGKTGTTNGPYDTWFVGYTAQRSTAVWVGDPGSGNTRKQLTSITVDGQYHGTIFGATLAGPIWKAVMNAAMQGLPAQPLP